MIEHLCEISLSRHPAAAFLAVIHHSLRITAVLMVSKHWKPVNHQFGMRIYLFVISHPQRVVHRSHAIEMMHVACRNDTLRTYDVSHFSHEFCNRFLVIISVASEVVGHEERQVAVHFLPFLPCLGLHCS